MRNLYRRYRPLRLSDVIGQEQVTEPLSSSLSQGKIGHAYLFVGPRGCGKTSVARILAHEVNGFKYELEDEHIDIIEIDGASNRGIDNIRELREKVAIAPSIGKYKIYIIDEVHMLTKEAFNALLKTLEEPPEHAIFIMATTDAYKIPVTITSRAQTYTFKLASHEVMKKFLTIVAQKEKINITDGALDVITKKGEGSFRDSLSLLDQISTLSDSSITKDMVVRAMGLPTDEKIDLLLQQYVNGDIAEISDGLKDLYASGIKADTLVEELISKILIEPKPELLPLLAKLPDVKAPYSEAKLLVTLTAQSLFTPKKSSSSRSSNSGTNAKDITVTIPTQNIVFDWGTYTDKVKALNDAVYSQLMKCKYEYTNGALEIYPMKRIVKTILSKDSNKRILYKAAGDVRITIHEADESPSAMKNDTTLSKISAIMGGEVTNDGGKNPFE